MASPCRRSVTKISRPPLPLLPTAPCQVKGERSILRAFRMFPVVRIVKNQHETTPRDPNLRALVTHLLTNKSRKEGEESRRLTASRLRAPHREFMILTLCGCRQAHVSEAMKNLRPGCAAL